MPEVNRSWDDDLNDIEQKMYAAANKSNLDEIIRKVIMTEKIKKMLGSVRFWFLFIISMIQILEVSEIIPVGTAQKVADAIQMFFGISIVVRTTDKFKP